MTQRDRVLKAARRYNGVCQTDFLLPDVCDGGPPITRVGARLFELDEQGYCFENIGWRDKTKVFRLTSEPEVESGASSSSASPALSPPIGSQVSSGVEPPRSGVDLSSESQGSLFAGIERAKGQHGFADQEAA